MGLDKQLKKITKITEAGKWLLNSFQPLQFEAASIYNRVCPTHGTSLKDNFTVFKKTLEAVAVDSPHESAILVEVLEKLPGIVERIKALQKSDVRELRMAQEFEVKALKTFVEACKLGISWARVRQLTPLLKSGETDEVIALKVDESRDWIKRARKEAASNCKPLEAAMLFRFAQAYKWWERESRAESAFWDILWRKQITG